MGCLVAGVVRLVPDVSSYLLAGVLPSIWPPLIWGCHSGLGMLRVVCASLRYMLDA